jgi:dipeptidyl aminopeptidase/acylaminoacyl peptidase
MARPVILDDLPRLPIVSDAVLSPDGARFAFVVKTWDLERDRYQSRIWLGSEAAPEGGRPASAGPGSDAGPTFSPDGRHLAFLSDRAHAALAAAKGPRPVDLWAMDLGGGEAVRLTALPGRISQARWSPDGTRLLFLFQPYDPGPPAREERVPSVLQAAGEELPPESESAPAPGNGEPETSRFVVAHRITRLHWREDGKGVLPRAREQLWTLDVSALDGERLWKWAPAGPGGRCLSRLTAGPYDVVSPAFSPDGSRVAFVSNRSADPDRRLGWQDLWLVPARSGAPGGGEPGHWDEEASGLVAPERLPAPAGPKASPAWSPEGRRIAYVAHGEPLDTWGTTNFHVWVAEASGGKTARDLMPEFDRTAAAVVIGDTGEMEESSPPVWRHRGREIVFLATDGPRVRLYAVNAEGGAPRVVHEMEHSAGGLSSSADGERLLFVGSRASEPPEVWEAASGGGAERRTRVTAAWRSPLALAEAQLVPVETPEGHAIDAWLLRPPDFDPKRRYPLLLQIHGGPCAAYGEAFQFEFHWLAAQGYCVLYANPRGSQGYGHDFAAAIRHDLAAPAHRDLMAAVDLVAARPYVDRERLGVTGGSWGGYMTNWVVTQTDRFRAALAQRSISDFELDFGVSDLGYEVEWMFGGPPWTHREVYERCSPLTFVESVRTPLLLLHSDEDWRCPPAQAEVFYGALKMLGREVEMVRFPNEPHGLSRSGTPSRRLERLRVIAEWFERHLARPRPGPAGEEPAGDPIEARAGAPAA